MKDSSSNEPRIEQDQPAAPPPYVVGSEWSGGEIQRPLEAPVRREKILPRRVLIKWALATIILYFGVRMIGTVIKHTVEATVGGMTRVTSQDDRTVVYKTRSGRIITVKKGPGGSIVISGGRSQAPPAEPTPPQTTTAPEKASPAQPAPGPAKR